MSRQESQLTYKKDITLLKRAKKALEKLSLSDNLSNAFTDFNQSEYSNNVYRLSTDLLSIIDEILDNKKSYKKYLKDNY